MVQLISYANYKKAIVSKFLKENSLAFPVDDPINQYFKLAYQLVCSKNRDSFVEIIYTSKPYLNTNQNRSYLKKLIANLENIESAITVTSSGDVGFIMMGLIVKNLVMCDNNILSNAVYSLKRVSFGTFEKGNQF